jgi:sirohydrochlorin ferrochelatase
MKSAPLLIVAHGQPSEPLRAEGELADLGHAVAALLPDVTVATATLAKPDALAKALHRLGPGGRIYPLFMAGGWFTRVQIPQRLAEAGAEGWTVLEPLGCDPAVHDLAVQIVCEAAGPPVHHVILAAHGSGKSAVPSAIARHVAGLVAQRLGISAEAVFIDQAPRLVDMPAHGPATLCLPFFAASGGHVTQDIPQALASTGFQGRLLPALGLDARLAAVIAAAALAHIPICAAACRWQVA